MIKNRLSYYLSFVLLLSTPLLVKGQAPAAHYDLMGMVLLDSVPAHSYSSYQCEVKLFEYVDSTGEYKFHSSETMSSFTGMYTFHNLPAGKYLVHASSQNTLDYFPTYYPDHAVWSEAQAITLVNGSNFSAHINMKPVDYIGHDNASISGNVSAIADSSNVSNVLIYLMDTVRNVLLYTQTDSLGNYIFDDLSFGTYLIHAEILNLPCDEIEVTLSPGQSTSVIRFVVGEEIVFTLPASIDVAINLEMRIYPNPVNNVLSIEIDDIKGNEAIVEIYNSFGQLVREISLDTESLRVRQQISFEDLRDGIYNVIVKVDNRPVSSGKIVKKR